MAVGLAMEGTLANVHVRLAVSGAAAPPWLSQPGDGDPAQATAREELVSDLTGIAREHLGSAAITARDVVFAGAGPQAELRIHAGEPLVKEARELLQALRRVRDGTAERLRLFVEQQLAGQPAPVSIGIVNSRVEVGPGLFDAGVEQAGDAPWSAADFKTAFIVLAVVAAVVIVALLAVV